MYIQGLNVNILGFVFSEGEVKMQRTSVYDLGWEC